MKIPAFLTGLTREQVSIATATVIILIGGIVYLALRP